MSSFSPRIMPPRRILIVGAGIAGIASALALSRELAPFIPDLQISIFERHDVLSTSGGAINLTPVAQRHLDQLGVLAELDKMGPQGGADIDGIEMFSSRSGKPMGTVSFTDRNGNGYDGYKGRRVMRIILSVALMAVVRRTKNVEIIYGKKLIKGEQKDDRAVLHFQDGTFAEGDLVLGCDGVHSATRTLWVDPTCPSEYTGISFVQTALSTASLKSPIHFRGTAMNVSRHGSLLTSYCDRDREELFVAAIVEFDEELLPFYRLESGREWRTKSIIKQTLGEEMRHRFGKSAFPCIREITNQPTDWMLYPVFQVPPRARWYNDRALLLGDAAHAVRSVPTSG